MEIHSKDYFKIVAANFSYSLVDTPLGRAVEMPAIDAFIYSSITGAGYLEDPTYPFTPKGLLKIFYGALQYKFVTGIFDNNSLCNTPLILEKSRPYLFKGNKYILPIEFDDEANLSASLATLHGSVDNPEDYVIQRIEVRKKGNGMEPFMEYLAAEHYKREGFIVETQIPLAHSTGSPDFGGYNLAESIALLSSELGLAQGFHVIELSLLHWIKNVTATPESASAPKREIVVGEAKTSTSKMTTQMNKYLNTGFFDYGVEISPLLHRPSAGNLGLLSVDQNTGKVIFISPQSPPTRPPINQQSYADWLVNYFKFYLVANLDNDQLNAFYTSLVGEAMGGQEEIAKFIAGLPLNDLVKHVKAII